MSSAREEIFAKLARRKYGGTRPWPEAVIPACAKKKEEEAYIQFSTNLKALACGLSEIDSPGEIPSLIVALLKEYEAGPDLWLNGENIVHTLPWSREPGLKLHTNGTRDDLDNATVVSDCSSASAETGALVFTSSSAYPVQAGLLPDIHIVLVRQKQIVSGFETIWEQMRTHSGNQELPRAIHIVGGPSRTGDIEATMVFGAHGPRIVHIILIRD